MNPKTRELRLTKRERRAAAMRRERKKPKLFGRASQQSVAMSNPDD